ncbi:PREDICTED: proline-rich protein 18 [Chrysochloris asiatica]|uniref:Proline-rich protein 18 n=1 Tax=Chrysochloris asiatica TaxID=185453 RepID=A0A9B0U0I3_CHRAS|nr:PREDICTED: proline-rich protein 18 [Chrysochloris asiatica]
MPESTPVAAVPSILLRSPWPAFQLHRGPSGDQCLAEALSNCCRKGRCSKGSDGARRPAGSIFSLPRLGVRRFPRTRPSLPALRELLVSRAGQPLPPAGPGTGSHAQQCLPNWVQCYQGSSCAAIHVALASPPAWRLEVGVEGGRGQVGSSVHALSDSGPTLASRELTTRPLGTMPLPPPAPRAKKLRHPERSPEALLSGSWASAPSRTPPSPATPRLPSRAAASRPNLPVRCAPSGRAPFSYSLVPGTSRTGTVPGPGTRAAARLARSLPSETMLLLRRRHLEPQPPPASPRARLPSGEPRAALRVSLLNQPHQYDDAEDGAEAPVADEDLVRKCTEWLRGLETAASRTRETAASRSRARRLDALPHPGTL